MTLSAPASVALVAQTDEFIERAHAHAVAAVLDSFGYLGMARARINPPVADDQPALHSHILFSDGSPNRPTILELQMLRILYRYHLAQSLRDVGYQIEYIDRQQRLFEIKGCSSKALVGRQDATSRIAVL